MPLTTDYLVIGSGLAGLSFALKAAELGTVHLCTKQQLNDTNTAMAQGGIAAVTGKTDSVEQHVRDTLDAGAGLCDPKIVQHAVEQGPDRIADLIRWGVEFDRETEDGFALTREGGHRSDRVLHIADHTGKSIEWALVEKVKAHPNIHVLEDHLAIDLITNKQVEPKDFGCRRCVGSYVLDKTVGKVIPILARATILATGGAGKVYLYTSNWSGATGDGIAMGYRAGCRVANLEFMQFHPTCLFHPHSRNFLISEALRGEGGELIDQNGKTFMEKYHEMKSLAPRDIVARSIDAEMKMSGADCVFLDITQRPADFLKKRFPAIYEKCLSLNIDITKQPIPVVPAAHYLCGGLMTDRWGRTDIEGLFALGETACTGLHGANRLASNSLLECTVFSHNAAAHLANYKENYPLTFQDAPEWNDHQLEDSDELIVVTHMWEEIRRLMWNYVGIVRSNRRLERAQHRLTNIFSELKEYYSHFKTHSDVVELRNIAIVADLTVKCARHRQYSIGIHYNLDTPEFRNLNIDARDTIIDPNGPS